MCSGVENKADGNTALQDDGANQAAAQAFRQDLMSSLALASDDLSAPVARLPATSFGLDPSQPLLDPATLALLFGPNGRVS